ncbi:hypothetical protein M5D96_007718 [Drosophila gunungcola]|uniref:Uncharacterized protein n=1 Tax=Drosophila gunungcola TaxID=103775 RepID=A0A9P9YLY1_9MUSC|nr:hypothetical protein M5D96_007718 [Drosophila gunungcola]
MQVFRGLSHKTLKIFHLEFGWRKEKLWI